MTVADFVAVTHENPWLLPTFVGLLGACIGSFLNVVIYRVPMEKSIVTPGSHCACGTSLRWYDNIPFFSWVFLRGRARCCGRKISARYPSVELLTALLFLVCWHQFSPAVAACGFVFVSALICATFIDLDHMIIPDVFTIGLAVAGVLLSLAVPGLHHQRDPVFIIESFRSGALALQGVLLGSGLVLWIALLAESVLRKEAMGFGDVKFVGGIGAFCGWKGAVFSIFGGAVVGTIWFALAFLLQRLTRDRAGKILPAIDPARSMEPQPSAEENPAASQSVPLGFGLHLPFGPMLALAGGFYFLFFQTWVDAWFATFNVLF